MALKNYDRGALFVDGVAQMEWTGGTVDFGGDFTGVETMANGGTIRGFTRDEPKFMNVTFTQKIRTDGTEFEEMIDAWNDGSTVRVNVWIGSKQFGAEGKINLGSLDTKEGTIEVNFMGAAPDIF